MGADGGNPGEAKFFAWIAVELPPGKRIGGAAPKRAGHFPRRRPQAAFVPDGYRQGKESKNGKFVNYFN
jgi:hypothetical protein